MGLTTRGKTGAAILAADYILARSILVVTPASGRGVWRRAFPAWQSIPRRVSVIGADAPQPTDVCIVSWGMLDKVVRSIGKRPDLIILDLMMPIKGGYEIIRELQDAQTRSIPVVVVSGRNVDRHLVDNLRAEGNVREFLPKPFSPAALGKAVHHILKTRRPR